ncbi:MAG: alpha/beta hydrolase-fold protein [Ignavibacteriaceae bacterium]|jgi:enterochelin esterase-like enzyme
MIWLRSFLTLITILILNIGMFSQVSRGTVKEGLTVHSEILNKDVRYTIYLPFDYKTSNRFYPVVYLLHGFTDNDIGWIQFGEANLIVDEAIANREIAPMILVMPDGGVSYYINNYNSSVMYEDFFIREFIPYIESHYRIRTGKRYRGIAGLSMGGYGTLVNALKHPDMFSACAAFSAAIYNDDEIKQVSQSDWELKYGILYGPGLAGKDRVNKTFIKNNPFHIIQNADPIKIKQLRIYIDCGDDDQFSESNSLFHVLLLKKKIQHEFRMRDGGHRWNYWRSGLVNALKFIGEGFHQP